MRNSLMAILICIIGIIIYDSNACIGALDQYSAGVVFTNNEMFYPDRFDSIGTEGTQFFKNCIMIKVDSSVHDVLINSPTTNPNPGTDAIAINNISITKNLINISVTYGGGCALHTFRLYTDNAITTSTPPYARFSLAHDGNGDMCKSLVTKIITFNLGPFVKMFPNIPTAIFSVSAFKNSVSDTMRHEIMWYPDNSCSVKYKHNDYSMVYLDFYSPGGNLQAFPRLAIVIDSTIKNKKAFDFGTAISSEITWLQNNKIVGRINDAEISKIKTAINQTQGQYWTLQDTVLGFNSWFTYKDKITITRESTVAVTTAQKSGCGLNVDYTLPPQVFGDVYVKEMLINQFKASNLQFSSKFGKESCVITLQKPAQQTGIVTLIDLKGRIIEKVNLAIGNKSIAMNLSKNLAQGMYFIKVKIGDVELVHSSIFAWQSRN